MSTYALKHTSKKTAEGNTSTISLQGKLTIENIEEIKLKFKPILTGADSFILEISEVNAMDLSFLQLLHSIEKSWPDKKSQINLHLNADLQNTMIESGFEKYLKI